MLEVQCSRCHVFGHELKDCPEERPLRRISSKTFDTFLYPMLVRYCPIAMAIQVWANLHVHDERIKREALWRKDRR